MKFFAAMLIAGALLLPFLALSAHADSVPVSAHAAPALQSGPWANGQPTTIAAQRGKVVVLLFWTRGCINCKHNLGYWNDWARRYHGTDVTVLSIHTPETPGEHSVPSVRRFV
jgi:peroxiredoxin